MAGNRGAHFVLPLCAALLATGFATLPAQAGCHYSIDGCADSFGAPLPGCFLHPCYWDGDPVIHWSGNELVELRAWAYAGQGTQYPGETVHAPNALTTANSPRTHGHIKMKATGLEHTWVRIRFEDPRPTLQVSGDLERASTVPPEQDWEFDLPFSVKTPSVTSDRAERIVRPGLANNPQSSTCQAHLQSGSPNDPQYCVVATYYGEWVEIPFNITVEDLGTSAPPTSPPPGPSGPRRWFEGSLHVFVETRETPVPVIPWAQYTRLSPNVAQPGSEVGFDNPNGVFDLDDVAYLDMDLSGTGTVNDVRLTGPDAGKKVTPNDYDATYALEDGELGEFCYVDADGNGDPTSGDPFYYGACDGKVRDLDVRIANAGAPDAGSQVGPTDNDNGDSASDLPSARLAYRDADGDGEFSLGDVLYVDIHGDGRLTINDVVLSGTQAGNLVTPGTQGFNASLDDIDLNDRYFDADGDGGYSLHDIAYLDNDDSETATVKDLRLSGQGLFGRFVGPADRDTTYMLGVAPHAAICFRDTDSSGMWTLTEPVYLQQSCAATAARDVRIANPSTGTKGSYILGSSSDAGQPTLALASAYCYYDADNDGDYSRGDPAYIRLNGACDTVHAGDILFEGYEMVMLPPHLNRPLSSLGVAVGSEKAFDGDGDQAFSVADTLYLDVDASNDPTVTDIRVTALGSHAPGSTVAMQDVDSTFRFLATNHIATCAVAVSGGTAVYLQQNACGPSSVVAVDIRLGQNGPNQPGRLVTGSDSDLGASSNALTAQYCYADNWQDGYEVRDGVYVNIGDRCDFVGQGDVALEGFAQFSWPPSGNTTTSTFPTSTSSASSGVPSLPLALAALAVLGLAALARRRL